MTDSRVKCSNCQEMGHTKVRCKKPLVPEDDGNDGGMGGREEPTEAAATGEDGGTAWPAAETATEAVDVNNAW